MVRLGRLKSLTGQISGYTKLQTHNYVQGKTSANLSSHWNNIRSMMITVLVSGKHFILTGSAVIRDCQVQWPAGRYVIFSEQWPKSLAISSAVTVLRKQPATIFNIKYLYFYMFNNYLIHWQYLSILIHSVSRT